MHKYVRKDVFPKISTRTLEQEVHAHRARRGGVYTTKDMHPRPKRHTPTLRNRCAGTTQAMHTNPKVCMLTSKATCTYTREYMHIYKGVHTLIRKGHMHLHKRVHALGQEVVMLALRNTRTRQGNRHPWIWKYMHIRQGAHVLLQDYENGFPRHSMPSASLFRCGMMREQRGRRFLQGRLNVIYFGDYELLRSHPRRNRQREKPMRGCWQAREEARRG